MTYRADLHLHSSFARGTSPSLSLESLVEWAGIKGIDLLASADFTHPAWLAELKSKLVPVDGDLFMLSGTPPGGPRFILGTELSCVFWQDGRSHRLHLLVYAPDLAAVDRLCAVLAPYGNLASDGRPILNLSGRDVVEIALNADHRCEVVPAHAWTPWYSVYGSKGGFDSLSECFGDMLPHVHAIETGLSSDPSMNWRVPELDALAIVSFSDAHSVQRMGRGLTVFAGEPSYDGFRSALTGQGIEYTVEFYPEEGKYHYDGHRKCGVCQHPAVTMERGDRCPVCGRKLTVGVLNRIEALSEREASVEARDGFYRDPAGKRPPFKRLVPLEEVIAEAMGRGVGTKGVRAAYLGLVSQVGHEMAVLEEAQLDAIASVAGERIAEAVDRVRQGNVAISPGYDGVYGRVGIWSSSASMTSRTPGASPESRTRSVAD